MFGRKSTHPTSGSNGEIYYTPTLSKRDAKKIVNKIRKSPDVKSAMRELKTIQAFRDASLATASDPNNPMENKYARKGRMKDFKALQRREQELKRFLQGYGIQSFGGRGDLKFMTNSQLMNKAKKRHFEGCDIMDGDFNTQRLAIYESVSNGSITEEMGSYLLSSVALEEANAIAEENKELVKSYLTAIKENDLSMMNACREEICTRKDCIPNITELKSDVNSAYGSLSDKEKLELLPSHKETLGEELDNEILDDGYDIDNDDRLVLPPKPEFISTNTEDDKERLLESVKESVDNGSISYSSGVNLVSLINKHFGV